MIVKKILLGGAILAVSALGVKAFAYSRLSEEEKVARITEKMARKLELTAEQKEQVHQINLQRSKGHQEAYEQGRKRAVIEAAVATWEQELKEVLTEEQSQKLGL